MGIFRNIYRRSWIVCLFVLISACSPQRPAYHEVVRRPPPAPKASCLICIDPGHGGKDPGAVSRGAVRIQEKAIALDTAKMVQTYLQSMGCRVYMTRTADRFVPLKKRAEMANRLRADLFVSIHFNSAKNRTVRGAEVYYYKSASAAKRSDLSFALAEDILEKLKQAAPARPLGVKHGNFCVIRETDMPAVLVEPGFLSHPDEVKLLANRAYLKRIAKAVADGICRYLSRDPKYASPARIERATCRLGGDRSIR